jgi:hypothetical protein
MKKKFGRTSKEVRIYESSSSLDLSILEFTRNMERSGMKIKKTILFITMIILPILATAEWQEVPSSSDQSKFFVDWTTLKVNGEIRRIWTLRSFTKINTQSSLNSVKSVTEFDCANDKSRELQVIGYEKQMAKGESGEMTSESIGKWFFIDPQTPMFKVLKAVCKK